MTSDIMDNRYLTGDKAGPFERKDRKWDVLSALDTHYESNDN
ncbi:MULTISPECIES: hypothetical protein [Clostridia]|nr:MULTISPECIES: hypothetical protein [Clostridia]